MKKYDDVSVVMGSRNEEKAIRKVITDIQKATNNQAEIVVVDSSTDRTPEIAENSAPWSSDKSHRDMAWL